MGEGLCLLLFFLRNNLTFLKGVLELNLLVSNNMQTIEKVREYENCDVALSLPSALIKMKKRKYNKIIVDNINIQAPDAVSIKDYLREKVSSNSDLKIFKQKIIAVWSVKGGAGKTTVVKKIAEAFDKNIKVLIIDLNLQDGGSDLSYMLELPVIPHIGMWFKEKTEQNFLDTLIQYKSNIFVLQSPPKRNLVSYIDKQDIDLLVKYAKKKFDVIIFDLPNGYSEVIESVFENSTKRIIVSTGLMSEAKRIKELNGDFVVLVNSTNKSWKPFFADFEHYEIKDFKKALNGE